MLFEEALAILEDAKSSTTTTVNTLPALPLSSLLERCEAFLDEEPHKSASLYLLRAMPGVPALIPKWWNNRFEGLEVHRLTDENGYDSSFSAWIEAKLTTGNPIVLLATPEQPMPSGLNVDFSALAICHPYRAFLNLARDNLSLTLRDFCHELSHSLESFDETNFLKFDTLAEPRHAIRVALEFQESLINLPAEPDEETEDLFLPPYFLGDRAYHELCERLGYDAQQLPPSSKSHKVTLAQYKVDQLGSRTKRPALISDFLERVANVKHALDPSSKPLDLSAVVAAVDAAVAVGEGGFSEQFDSELAQLGDVNAVLACLAASAHFRLQGRRIEAINYASEAEVRAPFGQPWLRVLISAGYIDLKLEQSAILSLGADALLPNALDKETRKSLEDMISRRFCDNTKQHGHQLLIDTINNNPPLETERQRILIEIGTTREFLINQNSTGKLAKVCYEYGIHMITVDMDPRNTRNAARMFAREGYDFQAVTAKGEDFLSDYDGVIDYLFLDAYDYDHGKHSEIRQSRYEAFLGSRIDEVQCHKMHLDCAEAVLEKMAHDGFVCFDDTWLDDNGNWMAKGKTAMPFFLKNGFRLVKTQSSAALLQPPE